MTPNVPTDRNTKCQRWYFIIAFKVSITQKRSDLGLGRPKYCVNLGPLQFHVDLIRSLFEIR